MQTLVNTPKRTHQQLADQPPHRFCVPWFADSELVGAALGGPLWAGIGLAAGPVLGRE